MRGSRMPSVPAQRFWRSLKSLLAGDFDWRPGRLPLYMFNDSPKQNWKPCECACAR